MSPFAILLGMTLQASPAQLPDSCAAGRIADVVVRNHSIFDADHERENRLGWAYRTANKLHRRTRDWVIRRELLFDVGDCLDQFRLDESARLLRATNFLSRVAITAEAMTDSTHRVIVDTHDEWSTRVDLRLNAHGYGIGVGEENVLGTGQTLRAFYIEHDVTRDFGVAYHTPQLAGTRWDLRAEGGQTRAGTVVREEVSYPWVGEISKWGALQSFRREDRFFDYIAGDDPAANPSHVLLPLREKRFDLAVVRRIGPRGNTALIGGALSYQQISYPGGVEIAVEGDFDQRMPADSATLATVSPQHRTRDNIRAFAMFGHRTIDWVKRRGMDSMRGEEDVRLGAELGLALGRSLPSLERDNDFYSTASLYTGIEAGDVLLVSRFRVDARRALDAPIDQPEWEDVYGDAELLAYFRPGGNPHHMLFARGAGVGAWNTRTPFQLTLGGERALRGYDRERMPGGQRAIFNLEDRIFFGGPFPRALDLGATVFADVGRIWPGDVPFGIDSGWKTAVGFGLRSSFPAGSRSVYRADIAWPVERGATLRDFRVQLSFGELLGLNPRAIDDQVLRSRPQGAAGQLFPFNR